MLHVHPGRALRPLIWVSGIQLGKESQRNEAETYTCSWAEWFSPHIAQQKAEYAAMVIKEEAAPYT